MNHFDSNKIIYTLDNNTNYKAMKNIPCAFYDELEAFALKKQKLTILYLDAHKTKTMVCSIISDLYTRNKIEYMKLESGWEIPLHCIISAGGKNITDYNYC